MSGLEVAIGTYRLGVERTEQHELADTFVETRTYRQLRQACSYATNENMIVLVYGRPGVGKSRCPLEYSKREMTSAPVIILCSRNVTWRYFIEMLADKLGLD